MPVKASAANLSSKATLSGAPSPFINLTSSAELKTEEGAIREDSTTLNSKAFLSHIYPFHRMKAWFRAHNFSPQLFPGNDVNQWEDTTSNSFILRSQTSNPPTYQIDHSNNIPYVSFSMEDGSFMLTDRDLTWENEITITIKFRANDRDQNLTRIGSIFSTVENKSRENNLKNVPLDIRYSQEDESEKTLLKTIHKDAIAYWECSSKRDWGIITLVLSKNWFSACERKVKKEKRIYWREEEKSNLGFESNLKAKIGIGFQERNKGKLNADISEIILIEGELSKKEVVDLQDNVLRETSPHSLLEGKSSSSSNFHVKRGGSVSLHSGADLESQNEYVSPDDLSTLQHWDTALEETFKDGQKIQKWDSLSAFGISTTATFQEKDGNLNDENSIFFDLKKDQSFTGHPNKISFKGETFSVHFLGYLKNQKKFFSIKKGLQSELFSIENSLNKEDDTKYDLKIRFNQDFFGNRSVVYKKAVNIEELFLLNVEVGQKQIDTYLHTSLNPNGYSPVGKPSSSLRISQDSSEGDAKDGFLSNAEGIVRLNGGTFGEIILYTEKSDWKREFIWNWIYLHYG